MVQCFDAVKGASGVSGGNVGCPDQRMGCPGFGQMGEERGVIT